MGDMDIDNFVLHSISSRCIFYSKKVIEVI